MATNSTYRDTKQELHKWLVTIEAGLNLHLAFKMNFLLQIIGPSLVFYFIKFQLWQAIFASHPTGTIGNYDLETMLSYQSLMLIVALVAQGYNSANLSEEIRLGKISTYLIYPFSFLKHHIAVFLSFEIIQLAIAAVTISLLVGLKIVPLPGLGDLLMGTGYCLAVALCWFTVQYLMGIFGFWLEETWVLRVMFITVGNFLSGAIIPLDLYPLWLQEALVYLPFPYLTYVPVKIMMGQYEGSLAFALLMILVWTGLFLGLSQYVWRKGVRLYTAAGM